MNTPTLILLLLTALEHLYIMVLETIATTSKKTSRTFGISVDELRTHHINVLLKNQGIYKGLIAWLLITAALTHNLLWGQLLFGYVIAAAFYGGLTSDPKIILKQGGLAIIGLAVSLLS